MTVSSGIIKKEYTSRDFRIWLVPAYSRINGVGHGVATLIYWIFFKKYMGGRFAGPKNSSRNKEMTVLTREV